MSRHADGSTSVDSMQDAHDFYNHAPPTHNSGAHAHAHLDPSPFDMDSSLASTHPAPAEYTLAASSSSSSSASLIRPIARSPTRAAAAAARSVSSPLHSSAALLDATGADNGSASLARSQQRSIKDLVNRFNQTSTAPSGPGSHIPAPNSRDRYRRSSEMRAKLQKPPRSPTKPRMSSAPQGKLYGHGISSGLAAVAAPHMAMSGMRAAQPVRSPGRRRLHKPLFGEVTCEIDTLQQPGYGIPDAHLRRGSEGSIHIAHHHKRSRSEAVLYRPHPQQQQMQSDLHLTVNSSGINHKRSRSDITHDLEEAARFYYNSPPLNTNVSSPSNSSQQHSSPITSSPDRPSRIPVSSGKRRSVDPTSPNSRLPHSRGASRNHFPGPASPKSRKSGGKENLALRSTPSSLPTLAARRYDPFATQRQAHPSQSVKAFIKVDPHPQSPPLRSSRPRQPVSEASTSASRAKSGQRFESTVLKKDGSGSDTPKYRSKKKIPELNKINFAERRARIQRAISANLPDDDKSDQGSASARSSMSGAYRQHSISEHDGAASYTDSADEATQNGQHTQTQDTRTRNGLGLSLEVNGHAVDSFMNGPYSAHTTFDESPMDERKPDIAQSHSAPELSNGTAKEASDEPVTLLSQVMRMRERSSSSTSRTDIESSPNFSSSPQSSESDDRAPFQMMLDGALTPHHDEDEWPMDPGTARQERFPSAPPTARQEHFPSSDYRPLESESESFDSDIAEVGSSPWLGEEASVPATPEKENHLYVNHAEDNDITPKQHGKISRASLVTISSDWNRDSDAYYAVNRILEQYRMSGNMTPDMLHEFERHVSKLSPNLSDLPMTDGSDTGTIRVLLDSLLADQVSQPRREPPPAESPYPPATLYSPADTNLMDSPPEEEFHPGTAIIYSPPVKHVQEVEEQRHEYLDKPQVGHQSPSSIAVNTPASRFEEQLEAVAGAEEDEFRPTPPPKDEGYSPRSSSGSNLPNIDQMLPVSTHNSRSSLPSAPRHTRSTEVLRLPEISTGEGLGLAISVEPPSTTATVPPPFPTYSPPPPPPPSESKKLPDLTFTETEHNSAPASMPTSPALTRTVTQDDRFRNFSTPASIRPTSSSSHKPEPISLPPSQSIASGQLPNRGPSLDDGTQPPTPNPEQRRLLKRRNVIKELVDTEYSYHQDMKIIEDIYKGTVGEMITADDKKVLFGNADQVEGFSLEFYDALRSAVTGVYVPPKSLRWQNKRGSFSTNNSGEREQSSEAPDEERDSTTRVGEVFAHYLTQMEKVYGNYLKNHDAANQRLAKLQGDTTVKCWLAECHNNASDITSAWDLDSLLVKPVQRILKYPLLLQQLLESTSPSHPDHKALEYAVKEIMNVTHRINEAKKRADLVEQMVSRKRKESDVRSGLAKAFGRRTEKLKERVGIAEAYQDTEFDELAHRFGGHFIRLQVCMRDVQGSIAEVDKAVHHFLEFANSLEAFIEVSPSTSPEIESKWRKFILAIRELATVALPDHKTKIQNHVIKPMLTAIELHNGPQNAISKRKKRILDYARCKTMEKAGQKPDKKTIEASEMYEALNEQLKIDLPRLYSLTAELIKACLDSNVVLQTQWMWLWKEKLAPVLDYVPRSDEQDSREMIFPDNIVPAFLGDYDMIHSHILTLAICNGALVADATNFLSPQTTLQGDESVSPSRATSRARRPSNISSGTRKPRKLSIGSEHSPLIVSPELDKSFGSGVPPSPSFPSSGPGYYGRMRSSSSLSQSRGRTPTIPQTVSANTLPSSRMPSLASKSSFSASRPGTANRPNDLQPSFSRISVDTSQRPNSGASYATAPAQPDLGPGRFSGMFSSAMPMSDSPSSAGPASPKHAPEDAPVMFVAASLFEFNIDKARREAGYPYLTYVEGEVFDVVAQKGELWLAKNQDDSGNSLGWIWEQHFVILSQDS